MKTTSVATLESIELTNVTGGIGSRPLPPRTDLTGFHRYLSSMGVKPMLYGDWAVNVMGGWQNVPHR